MTPKPTPRRLLATLALPELLRRLSTALRLMETLLKASAPTRTRHFIGPNCTDAFAGANKRRGVATKRRKVGAKPAA